MKIFVTGGTGFVGKRLISCLLDRTSSGDKIYLLSRSKQNFTDPRLVFLQGSLKQIPQFTTELLECDFVFHLAANASFGSSLDYDESNYQPMVALIEVLKKSQKLKNFVFVSTMGAVDRAVNDRCQKPLTILSTPHPRSGYGLSKLKAERALKESGLPLTIIRPGWVYGPHMRTGSHLNHFVTLLSRYPGLAHFGFPSQISLIHVDDLAKALGNAISNETVIGKIYFAGPETLSIQKIFEILYKRLYGKKPWQIPLGFFRFLFNRIHGFIPVSIAALFANYWWAHDAFFLKDFNVQTTKKFVDVCGEIIETNVSHGGKWLITGAGSGIGLALAKRLLAADKRLILIDKNIDSLSDFKNHPQCRVIRVDLASEDGWGQIMADLGSERFFCVIHNAGLGFRNDFLESKPDENRETVFVNFVAPFSITHALASQLTRDGTRLVFVGSSVAFHPLPGMALYAASKAALVNWAMALGWEWQATNRVLVFCPSGTKTLFQEKAGVRVMDQDHGLWDPDKVAGKILCSVDQKKRFVFMMPLKLKIIYFVMKFFPFETSTRLWGRLFKNLR